MLYWQDSLSFAVYLRSAICNCLYLSSGSLGEGLYKGSSWCTFFQSLHLCFMVRIPLGKSTWSPRCLLDLEGNLSFYPRLIEILVWQRECWCQPNEEACSGSLRKVEGSNRGAWGSAESLSWLSPQFVQLAFFFFHYLPEFSKTILLPHIKALKSF